MRQSGKVSKTVNSWSRLAQNASDLLVASHAEKQIERLLVHVVAAALAIDQTPTSQLIEPACDRGAGHAHIGSNLGDRIKAATFTPLLTPLVASAIGTLHRLGR